MTGSVLVMDAKEKYQIWLDRLDPLDPMKAELESVRGSEAEIVDRFYRDIAFGTAGLRGICGAGTNRMNVYTVGKASQGLAAYVNSVTDAGKIAVAYDSRIKSDLFAKNGGLRVRGKRDQSVFI